MSRRQAITLASCAVACCATSSLRPIGSAARAIELASPRWSATKARLRVLDVLMLAPLWPMAAQPGTVRLLTVAPAMADINACAGGARTSDFGLLLNSRAARSLLAA